MPVGSARMKPIVSTAWPKTVPGLHRRIAPSERTFGPYVVAISRPAATPKPSTNGSTFTNTKLSESSALQGCAPELAWPSTVIEADRREP